MESPGFGRGFSFLLNATRQPAPIAARGETEEQPARERTDAERDPADPWIAWASAERRDRHREGPLAGAEGDPAADRREHADAGEADQIVRGAQPMRRSFRQFGV